MTGSRKALTIPDLRALAHRMGELRGNMDGDCPSVRFTPTAYADGVAGEHGANWTVLSLNCDGACAAFWHSILAEIAKNYDVDFDATDVVVR